MQFMKTPFQSTKYRRVFLLEGLPEPLTRASKHLQLFDNYIENTRLRLRTIRDPKTKQWIWIMEKRFLSNENDLSIWQTASIYLSEDEHKLFEQFEYREIRKNRYFLEVNDKTLFIDLYLGELWGLCLAKVEFASQQEMAEFTVPDFSVAEVTQRRFFLGENLVEKAFADVQAEFSASLSAAKS